MLNYKNRVIVDEELILAYLKAYRDFDLRELNTENVKKAFWINTYNGLTNYLILKRRIRKSIMEQPQLFFIPKLQIGKHRFSLDDIEHGILRKNTRHRRKPVKQFAFWDYRKSFIVDRLDYRIHFALNCGAQSCPPIAFYSEVHLDKQLALAESNFIEQEYVVNHEQKTITCSKLFVWYKRDFVNVYLNDPALKSYKIIEKKYNWSI